MLSHNLFKQILHQTVRQRHSADHWSVVRKKNKPVDKALAHFDDFYKEVFRGKWPSIREGLLGKQKYVAVVNNYGDSDEIMAKFELNGAINVRTLFRLEKQRIQDRLHTNSMKRYLKKILADDQEAHQVSEQPTEKQQVSLSLQSSLESAEIDTLRIVDSKDALSAEILHQFVPATKIKGRDDFIPESTHYGFYKNDHGFKPVVEKEMDIHFPEHLNVYCFEEDNHSDFDPARLSSTGVLGYYLMDGGSIMPVLALDIQPGHKVLDLCAAPGGKSMLAIQTLYPSCIVSNDISKSRTDRIYNVCHQFLYDLKERWFDTGRLKITALDGRRVVEDNFDRILVDVPCTTDRHSLKENDNNIFRPSRIKERLKLPELQCELLVSALKLVRKGGIVVYSTCSLSPIQNDGVVHMALKQIWEETKMEVIVKDLSIPMMQTRDVFYLANRKIMKYGHLIVPQLSQNYGPTYFCKLQRIK